MAYAVAINTLNTGGKFLAWFFTGSHAMFSEAIHSLADTMNQVRERWYLLFGFSRFPIIVAIVAFVQQVILGLGLYHSGKQPDLEHPYGYVNMRYVSCLISGVGIFCVGAGLSW